MSRPTRQRIFRHSLTGVAALLMTLAMPMRASAAVSQGPICTNAIVAKERRNARFFEAEQSFQEQLKVGRERYNEKQINRAKVIAAMSEELQARQQTVVIHRAGDPDDNTDQPVLPSRSFQAVVALALGFIGLVYYLKRLKLTLPAPRPRPENSAVMGSRPLRRKYRVTALKPVTIWANVEVSKMERTPLGAKVRRTRDEPAWIQLKAGETQDKLGVVFGVHPDCVPHGRRVSMSVADPEIVSLGAWTDGELPMEFFDYFKLEVSG
jgi:hypothetical protein